MFYFKTWQQEGQNSRIFDFLYRMFSKATFVGVDLMVLLRGVCASISPIVLFVVDAGNIVSTYVPVCKGGLWGGLCAGLCVGLCVVNPVKNIKSST